MREALYIVCAIAGLGAGCLVSASLFAPAGSQALNEPGRAALNASYTLRGRVVYVNPSSRTLAIEGPSPYPSEEARKLAFSFPDSVVLQPRGAGAPGAQLQARFLNEEAAVYATRGAEEGALQATQITAPKLLR